MKTVTTLILTTIPLIATACAVPVQVDETEYELTAEPIVFCVDQQDWTDPELVSIVAAVEMWNTAIGEPVVALGDDCSASIRRVPSYEGVSNRAGFTAPNGDVVVVDSGLEFIAANGIEMDLTTVVAHEIGHALGITEHLSSGLMSHDAELRSWNHVDSAATERYNDG